jgi:hypothetical protein
MKDEEIKKKWEEFIEKYKELFKSNEEKWYYNLKNVEEYIIKYNKLPSKRDKNDNISKISRFISTQKQNYTLNKCIMKNDKFFYFYN